jgi:hypothetical protein
MPLEEERHTLQNDGKETKISTTAEQQRHNDVHDDDGNRCSRVPAGACGRKYGTTEHLQKMWGGRM